TCSGCKGCYPWGSNRYVGWTHQPAGRDRQRRLPPPSRQQFPLTPLSARTRRSPVSKHSYRRLAIVAGTALALGPIAPAMAPPLDAGSNGSAPVDIPRRPPPTLPPLPPAGLPRTP